jgi:BASS family bile acid:Na+ symporter
MTQQAGLADPLAWLGRQGTRAVAVSVFVSIALPFLGTYARPVLTESIIAMLTLAFLRVDPAALAANVRAPLKLGLATLWCMVVVPACLGLGLSLTGVTGTAPDLALAIILQAVAPPIMSAPAFAALMGLPAALPLALLIAAIMVTPLTAPVFATLWTGAALDLSPQTLGLKLFVILAGSWIAAALLRRLLGSAFIARQRERIDGLNVILLFIFAAALMNAVTYGLIERPLTVLGLTALAFGLALSILALTALLFAPTGRRLAFALGFACGHRNMGLMLAAAGTTLPDRVWLYFAVAQFPIYLLPQLLKPVARWYSSAEPAPIAGASGR